MTKTIIILALITSFVLASFSLVINPIEYLFARCNKRVLVTEERCTVQNAFQSESVIIKTYLAGKLNNIKSSKSFNSYDMIEKIELCRID